MGGGEAILSGRDQKRKEHLYVDVATRSELSQFKIEQERLENSAQPRLFARCHLAFCAKRWEIECYLDADKIFYRRRFRHHRMFPACAGVG